MDNVDNGLALTWRPLISRNNGDNSLRRTCACHGPQWVKVLKLGMSRVNFGNIFHVVPFMKGNFMNIDLVKI